jgi:hypothetical protein
MLTITVTISNYNIVKCNVSKIPFINTLTVYQWNDERDIFRQLWAASDDKGNKWFNQILRLQQDIGPYHIIFKAVRGNWDLANIALDDIVIANSNCNGKCLYDKIQYMCGNYRNKKPTTEKIAFELT